MLAKVLFTGVSGVLQVRFTNETEAPQWLSKARALLGEEPDGGFLEVKPKVNYAGRVLHRLPYAQDELLELAPGQSVTSDPFDVLHWYAVEPCVMLVRYAAAHPLAGLAQVQGPLTRIESDTVSINTRHR
jgi:hypothetical protein